MTPSRSNPATAIPPTRRSQPKKPRPPPPAIVRQRERAHSSPPAQVLPPHSTFLILTSFDYARKEIILSRPYSLGEDMEEDITRLMAYFKPIKGKNQY